jgi:two-component system response regulator YesN
MENTCRIMVIDDEFIMRQGIRFMMRWEEEGYEIAGEATNGKEALDLIPQLNPHIILCDIAMPVMNGLDFIKIVSREYPDIKTVVLSSYDNFEYVREALVNGAVDYVLKPTLNPEELLKILRRTAEKIPGLQLGRKKSSSIEEKLEDFFTERKGSGRDFRDSFPYSCFRLFVLPLNYRNQSGADVSQVLYEKAEGFLKKLDCCRYLKFLYHQEIMCVVLNYGRKDEDEITGALSTFLDEASILSDRVLGILGERHIHLEELREEFERPGFLEHDSFYNKGIHLYKEQRSFSDRQPMEKFDFRKFTSAIAVRKYPEAIALFNEYIYKAVKNQMQEFKLKNQTKNLFYNIVGSSEEHVEELEDLRREYFRKIEEAPYCDDFLKVYDEMMGRLGKILDNTGDNLYLGKMLDYIQQHSTEDLNLQELAEEFNFSYSYLSACFNQHVSEGFSEYLNNIRIQKACELLVKSRMSISQISSAVGYADQSYFSRVFKRITGKNPSTYRRENW